MRYSEKDAAAIGGDVAPLVDDVEDAATHHLQKYGECDCKMFGCWKMFKMQQFKSTISKQGTISLILKYWQTKQSQLN